MNYCSLSAATVLRAPAFSDRLSTGRTPTRAILICWLNPDDPLKHFESWCSQTLAEAPDFSRENWTLVQGSKSRFPQKRLASGLSALKCKIKRREAIVSTALKCSSPP